jgi:hypothetical protein
VAESTEGKEGQEPRTYTQDEYEALQAEKEALLAKRDEILSEAKKAKDRLRAFDGVDPEEHKTLKQKLADLETQKKADKAGITSQELERMRGEVRQSLEEEYAEFKTRAEQLATENRALKLDNVVKGVMGKSGVRSERVDDLFRLTADQYDLTDDGKPVLKEKMGLEIEKYVAEDLRKSYPEWFEGTGSSGGGAPKSAAGGGGSSRVVTAGDNDAFISNLEGIAKGTTEVR